MDIQGMRQYDKQLLGKTGILTTIKRGITIIITQTGLSNTEVGVFLFATITFPTVSEIIRRRTCT